ncbi:hypothetical protein SHELI_v1c09980 [Spiroplasma helicoides]|uniref:Lipoprotein associated domain-containing protein n=1 Tax=Spiroplasma helicoides TaxID=216938 RepID=A0A1B3SLY2_9MOLU|nr:lipoprotein [Spiroplasma helicoides]AOG60945.1 hypothetical protein SHELI_v1c09980 [Spiroplasma helicoides]
MKKLLSVLAATGLVASSSSVAVACNKKADDTAASTLKDLSKIAAADLKLSPSANTEAAAKTAVIAQIKEKLKVTVVENTDVKFSGFSAATAADKAGKITVESVSTSKLVTGKVEFSLVWKDPSAKTDLSALAVKDLGEIQIASDASVPTLSQIVSAINSKNANYGLQDSDVALDGDASATKAKLKAASASTKFTGSVEVSYTVKKAELTPSIGDVAAQSGLVYESKSFSVTVSNVKEGTDLTAVEDGKTLLDQVKVAKGTGAGVYTVSYTIKAGEASAGDGSAKEEYTTSIKLSYGTNVTKSVAVTVAKNDLKTWMPAVPVVLEFTISDEFPTDEAIIAAWNEAKPNQKISASDVTFVKGSGDKEAGIAYTVTAKKESTIVYGSGSLVVKNKG